MPANNKDFEKLNQELGFEFNKYVLARPEILEEIPLGAQIIFLLDDNPEFNSWSKEMNTRQREPNQPMAFLHIEHLLSDASRIVNPHLEFVS